MKAADASIFAYHLKLNGKKPIAMNNNSGTIMVMGANGQMSRQPITPEMEASIQDLQARIAMRDGPTDFWGEYVLVK